MVKPEKPDKNTTKDLRAALPLIARRMMVNEALSLAESGLKNQGTELPRPVTPGCALAYWTCYILDRFAPDQRARMATEGKAILERMAGEGPAATAPDAPKPGSAGKVPPRGQGAGGVTYEAELPPKGKRMPKGTDQAVPGGTRPDHGPTRIE